MEYTRKLAEFCAGIGWETLPDEVRHKAKLCILDWTSTIQFVREKKLIAVIHAGTFSSLGKASALCVS